MHLCGQNGASAIRLATGAASRKDMIATAYQLGLLAERRQSHRTDLVAAG